MQITIRRTGGFAGIEQETTMDTAERDDAQARRVVELVRSTGFFDLAPASATEEIGADLMRQEITVRDGEREKTIAFNDESPAAEKLRPLVEAVAAGG
jgi:hypothetical protein